MRLGNFIYKSMDIAEHIAAGGLAALAVKHIYNGIITGDNSYYPFAVLEGIVSIGIEAGKYISRRNKRKVSECLESIQVTLKELERAEELSSNQRK